MSDKLVAQDHINVRKRIFDLYPKPKEIDYNAIAKSLNTKLKDEVIDGESYDKAMEQLSEVIEKSEKIASYEQIGERGDYSFEIVQK